MIKKQLLISMFVLAVSFGFGQTDTLVSGNALRIGYGNQIIDIGHHYMGNAIGTNNILMSANSLAVGSSDTIYSNSINSVALGSTNYIQGLSSMAFGSQVKITGNYNVGIGRQIRVSGTTGSMAIGTGVDGSEGFSGQGNVLYAPLLNTANNSLVIGFNSTKPTVFVSESPNDYGEGVLNKTGRVAIGDVVPQAKLHIRSDIGENAGIILDPADLVKSSVFIQLRDVSHHLTVNEQGDMLLSAGNNDTLYVTSSNFKVDENKITLGMPHHPTLYLSSKGPSSISTNAKPVSAGYERISDGPSYTMEFGSNAFMLRTATYMDPRGDLITNWATPVTVATNGAITLMGKVGVNTENNIADYALAVDGGILTTKVHILNVADWQDHVFGEDYQLMPLKDVEAYVATHRHLPGIPSEAEVKADGFDMAEMQAALLGKIEELVLHAIRQQKEIDSLRNLVRVNFGYDACGNRVSRTLEFSKADSGRGITADNGPMAGLAQWQASITDCFAGVETMLFPNPTEGGFFLTFNGDELPKGVTALLCAVDGTVLEERTVKGTNEEFDLGKRAAGVYLLRLVLGDTVKTWKVIKRN